MDINIFQPADTAVATVRTLPWFITPSTSWRQVVSVRSGVLASTEAPDHAISMTAVDAYRACGVIVAGMCVGITQDQAAAGLVATGADHQFSTRLGPSASPPV